MKTYYIAATDTDGTVDWHSIKTSNIALYLEVSREEEHRSIKAYTLMGDGAAGAVLNIDCADDLRFLPIEFTPSLESIIK